MWTDGNLLFQWHLTRRLEEDRRERVQTLDFHAPGDALREFRYPFP
jgi:hypothetical protein